MNYEVIGKYAKVTLTISDFDKNATVENVYNYMPKEVKDFRDRNKDKSNFKETYITGRTSPYQPNTDNNIVGGITYIFELT